MSNIHAMNWKEPCLLVKRGRSADLGMNMLLPFKFLAWVLITYMAIGTIGVSACTNDGSARNRPSDRSLVQREQTILKPASHNASFSAIPHSSAPQRCQDTRPPEALATPSLSLTSDADEKVIVSFIVGVDGRVHSALVLHGGDEWNERAVLEVVRHWRYRPATCNGVPTEFEAKVEFSRP